MTDQTIIYIDSVPYTPEGWQELPVHVHVRASGQCVKNEDGDLCDNDLEELREQRAQAVRSRNSAIRRLEEERRAKEGNIDALNKALQEKEALATWATQAVINLYLMALPPAEDDAPPAEVRATVSKFLNQAPTNVLLTAFATLADQGHAADLSELTKEAPCPICGGTGWWGARHHDPAHYASHVHCQCAAPCQPCSVGEGFKSPKRFTG